MATHTFSNDWDVFNTGIGQHQDAVNQAANDLTAYQQLVAKFRARGIVGDFRKFQNPTRSCSRFEKPQARLLQRQRIHLRAIWIR